MNVFEVRRLNLIAFIAAKFDGNRASFCRSSGKNPNLINLVLTKNPDFRRNIGEKLARDIEVKAGMQALWLDSPQGIGARSTTRVPLILDGTIPELPLIFSEFNLTVPFDEPRFVSRLTSMANVAIITATDGLMSPTIELGDMIWLDLGVKKFQTDGVYALKVGEQTQVRRIQESAGGYELSCDSRTPAPTLIAKVAFNRAYKISAKAVATMRVNYL